MTMRRMMLTGPLLLVLLLPACVVTPRHGPDYVMAPALPVIVELGVEPYYFHDGFYYRYHEHEHRWSYSRDRAGPWHDLPHDRYPREIRYKGRDPYRDRDRDRDHRD